MSPAGVSDESGVSFLPAVTSYSCVMFLSRSANYCAFKAAPAVCKNLEVADEIGCEAQYNVNSDPHFQTNIWTECRFYQHHHKMFSDRHLGFIREIKVTSCFSFLRCCT